MEIKKDDVIINIDNARANNDEVTAACKIFAYLIMGALKFEDQNTRNVFINLLIEKLRETARANLIILEAARHD